MRALKMLKLLQKPPQRLKRILKLNTQSQLTQFFFKKISFKRPITPKSIYYFIIQPHLSHIHIQKKKEKNQFSLKPLNYYITYDNNISHLFLQHLL